MQAQEVLFQPLRLVKDSKNRVRSEGAIWIYEAQVVIMKGHCQKINGPQSLRFKRNKITRDLVLPKSKKFLKQCLLHRVSYQWQAKFNLGNNTTFEVSPRK
jgi:hypothetical protein